MSKYDKEKHQKQVEEQKNLMELIKNYAKQEKYTPTKKKEITPIPSVTKKPVSMSQSIIEANLKATNDMLTLPRARFDEQKFKNLRIGLVRYSKRKQIELEFGINSDGDWVIIRKS